MVSSRATAPTPSPLIQLTPRAAAPLEDTASRLMGPLMDNNHQPAVRVFNSWAGKGVCACVCGGGFFSSSFPTCPSS